MTSENPYQAPEFAAEITGLVNNTTSDLRSVAFSQKGIMVCILLYFVAFGIMMVTPAPMRFFLSLGVLIDGLIGMIFVLLLATRVYGTAVGIVLGVLTLVPCLGLLVLLAINDRATKLLKKNGKRVGLLGADLAQF